jgi:hypothetical protein
MSGKRKENRFHYYFMGSPLPSAFLPPPSLKLRKAEKKYYYKLEKGETEQEKRKETRTTPTKMAREKSAQREKLVIYSYTK